MSTLRDWRLAKNLTLADVADDLGITGVKPGRTVQRFETGERAISLEIALDIERITNGEVTPADMDAARQDWLARNPKAKAA